MALDVGGANIKAAHGAGQARTLPFELWKRPDELGRVLAALTATFPPYDRVALTMTAELCDCYPTKAVGVNAVLDAVLDALLGQPIEVWGVDGRFHEVDEVRQQPALAAASNWLALATLAARLLPDGPGLLIDIGTTTTDLIPLAHGRAAARGRTDTERLQNGELVYAGVRRTPICALATELPYRGLPTGLAAELFASTLDVYLTLDAILPDPKDLSTADGRPATKAAARDRLARMIGTDRDTFTAEDALAFAHAADEALLARLEAVAGRACRATIGRPRFAVVSGSGEFLARRLARRVIEPGGAIVGLNEAWGPVASSAGCAYALLVLASERDRDQGEVAECGGRKADAP
jgi:probable H4MPT-linked C1 transfer pathway protein